MSRSTGGFRWEPLMWFVGLVSLAAGVVAFAAVWFDREGNWIRDRPTCGIGPPYFPNCPPPEPSLWVPFAAGVLVAAGAFVVGGLVVIGIRTYRDSRGVPAA